MLGAYARTAARSVRPSLRPPARWLPHAAPHAVRWLSAPAASGAPAPVAPAAPPVFKDQALTWVDKHAPAWAQPYLKLSRVDRPIGTWLVLLPGWWGIALAAPAGGLPDPYMLGLFAVGAFAMRGAGCTVNDMWDKDFDGRVARTASRPLASGRVSRTKAFAWLAAQGSAAFAVLTQFSLDTVVAGAAVVPLVIAYPALKRFTHWPQAALGLAMNYGIVMGPPAVAGTSGFAKAIGLTAALAAAPPAVTAAISTVLPRVGDALATAEASTSVALSPAAALGPMFGGDGALVSTVLPLYAGAALWTIVYDTIYAHQDKGDDVKLGLKSTAILMGGRSKTVLTAFALASGGCWAAAGIGGDLGAPFLAAAALATGHQVWQARTAAYDGSDMQGLAKRFISNKWVGWLIFFGIVAGKLLQKKTEKDEEEEGGPRPASLTAAAPAA